MNSLSVSGSQVKFSGNKVVVTLPKKKGDYIETWYRYLMREDKRMATTSIAKMIVQIGEPLQLTNENGKKLWHCPECNMFGIEINGWEENEICPFTGKYAKYKPLVVVPQKISDKGKNWMIEAKVRE